MIIKPQNILIQEQLIHLLVLELQLLKLTITHYQLMLAKHHSQELVLYLELLNGKLPEMDMHSKRVMYLNQ